MNPHHPTKQFAAVLSFVGALGFGPTLGRTPGMTKQGDQKVLTLISRDPPWVRCNNNMQVAAELTNVYRIPVQIVPTRWPAPAPRHRPCIGAMNDRRRRRQGKRHGRLHGIVRHHGDRKRTRSTQVGRLMASDPPKHDG
jgi:hypothetical protein